jgi:hypothetical protein
MDTITALDYTIRQILITDAINNTDDMQAQFENYNTIADLTELKILIRMGRILNVI